MNTPSEVKVLS